MRKPIDFPFFGAMYLLITSVLVKFSSIFVTSLIVLGFSTEIYGLYSHVLNTSLLLATISSMSVHQIFVRNIASSKTKISLSDYFISLMIVYFIIGGLFLVFIGFFSNGVISDNKILIFIIAGSECFNMSLLSILNGKERFKDVLVVKIVFSFVLIISFFIVKEFFNYISPMIYLLSSFISNVIILIKLGGELKAVKIKFQFKVSQLFSFFTYYIKPSFPIFLSGLMVTPIQWFMVNKMANDIGFQEVGLFNISIQFRMIIIMITSSISTALLPVFSRSNDLNNKQKIFNFGMLLTLLIGVFITVVTYLFIGPISEYLEFPLSRELVLIIIMSMFGGVLLSCFNLFSQKLLSEGKAAIILMLNSIWGGCLLFLVLFLENLNSLNAAIYVAVSYVVLLVAASIVYYFTRRKNYC